VNIVFSVSSADFLRHLRDPGFSVPFDRHDATLISPTTIPHRVELLEFVQAVN
jgi:hypothetical protein